MSPALEAQSLHHRTTGEAQPPFFINLGLFKTKVKRDGLHTQSPFRLYVFNNYHIPGGAFVLKYKDIVTGFKKKKNPPNKEPCEIAFPYQYPSLQHLLPKTECTKSMITIYAEQKKKKRHRFIEQSFGLWGRRRGWDGSREQH